MSLFILSNSLFSAKYDLPFTPILLYSNALVSNKLDYCNSLFYNPPDTSIGRLQLVQNSLARFVFPSVRRCHHISPTLAKLHWLPIRQRIVSKIATITHKTLQNKQLSYFNDLVRVHTPIRNLRSSKANLLVIPNINSAIDRRSFSYAAPTVWNLLPLSICNTKSLSTFRSLLKAHLFPP